MLPPPPMKDVPDGRSRHPKAPCQFYLTKLITQGANLANLSLGQLCHAVAFTIRREARVVGMADILGGRHPFQVSEAIVGLDAVDVVALLVGGRRAGEGGKNQAVKIKIARPATAETYVEITRRAHVGLEDSASPSTLGSSNPSHSTEAGDLIPAFVADNGTPILGFQNKGKLCRLRVHQKGRSFRCHAAGRHPPSRLHLL